jgi:hypothetical protein
MKEFGFILTVSLLSVLPSAAAEPVRAMRFHADSPEAAKAWQQAAREKLFALMMGGQQPTRGPLNVEVVRRIEEPAEGCVLEEITLQSLPERRAHAWLARPLRRTGKVGAVLALHGHGGKGEEIVRGLSLYWYGRELAQRGYVVIAPDVGQHELQHTNWCLMGERTWDALRCVDYVSTLPEVDSNRLAVAGLSLGGETTMYVAALDERLKLACSSGWLTTVANMKNGHCPCFNFPGLEEQFDFADIFACVAPRTLICELGEQERAPGGFPVEIGRKALAEINPAYRVGNAESNLVLTVHPAGHVFSGRDFLPKVEAILGETSYRTPGSVPARAWARFTQGPEFLDGVGYYWLGQSDLLVTFDVLPQPGDVLELGWGSKADQRGAVLLVNGQSVPARAGGWWGFRWVRVPIPAGLKGNRYELEFRAGERNAAFLSEVRLVSATGTASAAELQQPAFKSSLRVRPGVSASAPVEAFPEMRPLWDREPQRTSPIADQSTAQKLRQAEKNSRLGAEGLFRCRRYVDGWLAHADPATGLIPRNLGDSRDYWNGRDSGADNYPFMVLTAALTDRALLQGRLLDMLRTETRLTSRVGRLPDDYSFSKKGWRREQLDLDQIIFDGAEYVKDGLLYVAEWLGQSPWSERMLGILDDIWAWAPIDTPAGKIPTHNFEVNGDLLQACARCYWFTGDRKYLDWAVRLGDYYLLGTNHPTRNLKELRLMDHGCEVINGLSELYVATSHALPEKRQAYTQPLHEIFDQILDLGRNEDGLLYTVIYPQTHSHSSQLCDTWGYNLDGFYTVYLLDDTQPYREAVRKALGGLKGKYVGAPWADKSADGYADSIEGAINLFNREPVPSAADWIDSQIRLMWSIQKADGVIEAWHGDGNFARTTLMYVLWKSQGLHVEPWRADVRVGAVPDGRGVLLYVAADQPWSGRILFDSARHRRNMHLPLDYPRINQFPEWFTVEAENDYTLADLDSPSDKSLRGRELQDGIAVELRPGAPVRWRVATRGNR